MNAGWYDENMGRSFPLLADTVDVRLPDGTFPVEPSGADNLRYLSNRVLVDFGSIIGPDAGYDDATDVVYLYRVARDEGLFTFEFRSTAAGLDGLSLIFCRDIDEERFAVERVDATDEDEECPAASIWSGYLVTGDLAPLRALLPEDVHDISGDETFAVEPTLSRNLGLSSLDAIHLANGERTLASTPPGCREPCYDYERKDVYIQATCLQGPLRFQEGYNNAIVQNSNEGSLTFAARSGAGEGEPCGEVSLFEGEEPPQGSSLLTGGHTCDETIRSINGVNKRLFAIIGGNKVAVEPATTDLHQFRVIILGTDEPPTDCDPPVDSEEPCECGPAESE